MVENPRKTQEQTYRVIGKLEKKNKLDILPLAVQSLVNSHKFALLVQEQMQPGDIYIDRNPVVDYLLVADDAVSCQIHSDTETFPRAKAQQLAGRIMGSFVTGDDTDYEEVKDVIKESGVLGKEAVHQYFDAIKEETSNSIDSISSGEVVDLRKVFFGIMAKIAPRTLAGGIDLPEGLAEDMVYVMAGATDPSLLVSPKYNRIRRSVRERLLNFVEKNKGRDLGVIKWLFDRFPEDRAVLETTGIMTAAFETTAGTLVGLFNKLSKNPKLVEEIRQEVLNAKSYEDLALTRAAFVEAARLYPIAWRTLREASCDTEIAGVKVRQGTLVSTLAIRSQRDKKIYGDDADEFNPKRFIENPGLLKYAYHTWNHGTHICAGVNLAIAEGTLILATVMEKCTGVTRTDPQADDSPIFEASLRHPEILVSFTK